jgi:hypothetical protein
VAAGTGKAAGDTQILFSVLRRSRRCGEAADAAKPQVRRNHPISLFGKML